MPVDIGTIGCAERFRFPRFASKIAKWGNANRRSHATGISNNKDLEIETITANFHPAPAPMTSIDTAQ